RQLAIRNPIHPLLPPAVPKGEECRRVLDAIQGALLQSHRLLVVPGRRLEPFLGRRAWVVAGALQEALPGPKGGLLSGTAGVDGPEAVEGLGVTGSIIWTWLHVIRVRGFLLLGWRDGHGVSRACLFIWRWSWSWSWSWSWRFPKPFTQLFGERFGEPFSQPLEFP